MKKKILGLIVGFLFIGVNLFAADGDLIVNGSVGIGTTSPGAKLQVDTATIGNGEVRINASGGESAIGYYTSGDDWVAGVGGWGNNNKFTIGPFSTNSGPKLIIDTAGNVGIGTTGPGYKLDVNGNLRTTDIYLTDGVQIEGLSGRNYFRDSEAAGSLRVGAAWGMPGIYAESAVGVLGGASGASLQNNALFVTTAGNVGIGTTNPGSYKLYVSGTLNAAAYAVGGTNGLTLSAQFGCGNCGCGPYQICTLSWTNGILTGRSCSSDSGCR